MGTGVSGQAAPAPATTGAPIHLRESAVSNDGERLGELGARILAEALLGVITRDPESYLALEPDWQPTLPARGDTFKLRELLVWA